MNASHSKIPRPPARVLTRVIVPTAIIAGAAAAVLWAGWRSFAPATSVNVVQVVLKSVESMQQDARAGANANVGPGARGADAPADSASARLTGPSVQAPGWLEPAPFPIMVSALTPGTVRDLLVLEGERVSRNQVLVQLYDEEQQIALQLAQAMADEQAAKLAEMNDELQRKQKLVAGGAVSAAEVARLGLRVNAMEASVRAAHAERDMKALVLERTKVRAPSDGVVMARLVSPGMAAGAMQDGKPLIELYDPASQQVRVDIPLADAGLVAIGQPAEIQVDVLPNRVFRGTVVRMVHLADIAKNTVQAKVLVTDPAPELKPEMLARVRIFQGAGATNRNGAAGDAGNPATAGLAATRERVWAPGIGLRRAGAAPQGSASPIASGDSSASAFVVVDLRDSVGLAEQRTVTLTGNELDGWFEIADGLRAGDLLITTDSASVQPGERVRIIGAAANRTPVVATRVSAATQQESPHANH